MTDDKHRKRAARKAAGEKGITLAAQVRAHREATKAMPAATVPAPIALQLARHLRAAGFHLSEVRDLAARERLIPDGISAIGVNAKDPTGPYAVVDDVLRAISGAMTELWVWAERTAHASGAIPVMPDLFDKDPAQDRARAILYPGVEEGWCARGGTMPRPGDEHQVAETNTRSGVRYSLPGPVPTKTLSRYASNTSDAKKVVAGTPAQPVWDAYDDMHAYLSGWMDRAGDSPADLAAALDGLVQFASDLPDAVGHIIREVRQRLQAGRITGVDVDGFTAASAEFDTHFHDRTEDEDGVSHLNHVRGALAWMRVALEGATATVTPAYPDRTLARKFAGQPPAVIREELGKENFVQRQIEKVRPGDPSRAGQLIAMLDFLHASGLPEYDGAQHEAALRGTPRALPTSEEARIADLRAQAKRRLPAALDIPDSVLDEVEEDAEQPSNWTTPAPDYTGHQAHVVLQDTATGCWRGWTDVSVSDGGSMWNPTVDGEYFTGYLNESRLVMTVGTEAAALLGELPALVGSVHEGEGLGSCLVCHDREQATPPTTLRQLEHQAHRVRAAFERRAGLGMGEGAEVRCAGRGGVLVATMTFLDGVAPERLRAFEWSADRGWSAVVRTVSDPAVSMTAATSIDSWEAWRPARVAEEIEKAIDYYSGRDLATGATAESPRTLQELDDLAHQVVNAFERLAGLPLDESPPAAVERDGNKLAVSILLPKDVGPTGLLGVDWSSDHGWKAIVRYVEGQPLGPVTDALVRTQIGKDAAGSGIEVFEADLALPHDTWEPATVAAEIQRAIQYYA